MRQVWLVLEELASQFLRAAAREEAETSAAKAALSALIDEVIGEDLPIPTTKRAMGKTWAVVGNRVRAEQRQLKQDILGSN